MAAATKELSEVKAKIREAEAKKIEAEASVLKKPDMSQISQKDLDYYRVHEMTLPDGTPILVCGNTKFDNCQQEWLDQQKYFSRAAEELGITILYGDVTRTIASSDAGRARKGNIVAQGGRSPHNYGVAIDIVLYKDGHSIGSSTQTEFAQLVQQYSDGQINWGGNWSASERHHYELSDWRSKYMRADCLTNEQEREYFMNHPSEYRARTGLS